jgi:hypothetical protein
MWVPPDEDEAAWKNLLVNTEIMTEEGVTVGGTLLFGTTPNRFLPHAGIDVAAFPGTEKDYAARERVALRGPMTPLFDVSGAIVENGLIEQALEFVRRNTPVTAVLESGRRVENLRIPRKRSARRSSMRSFTGTTFSRARISSWQCTAIDWRSSRQGGCRTASRPSGCAREHGLPETSS